MKTLASLLGALALLLAAPGFAQTRAPDLQAGDTVTIVIPERDGDRAVTVTIDEYDEIALGVYGRVEIGGVSQGEALRRVSSHLSNYLRNTSEIRLHVESRGVLVFVTGQVREPGRYAVARDADPWVAIRAAGGELDSADLERVVIQRADEEVPVNLVAFLTRRDATPLPELEPGDLVFVPADPSLGIGESGVGRVLDDASLSNRIFVMGAVQSPGMFERGAAPTVLTALALAGGPALEADIRNTRVLDADGAERVDLARAMADGVDPTIEAPSGVIVYVPFRLSGEANPLSQGISVIGGFNTPRLLETNEPLPLFEVIALAGGPGDASNTRHIHHVRQGDGYTVALHYNLRRFFRHGGALGTVMVHPGDVLYLRPDRENAWEVFVGGISDVAVISSAVLLFVTLNNQL